MKNTKNNILFQRIHKNCIYKKMDICIIISRRYLAEELTFLHRAPHFITTSGIFSLGHHTSFPPQGPHMCKSALSVRKMVTYLF